MNPIHNDFDYVISLPVRFSGSDLSRMRETLRILHEKLSEGKKAFLVDAAELKFIDSAGLGFLVKISRELGEVGATLEMAYLSKEVLELFEMAGLFGLLESDHRNGVLFFSFPCEAVKSESPMECNSKGKIAILKPKGVLEGLAALHRIRQQVLILFAAHEKIIWDLSGVTHLDASITEEIARLSVLSIESRIRMDIVGAHQPVREAFMKQIHSLSFFADMDEALGQKLGKNLKDMNSNRIGIRPKSFGL